jgi:lipoprotein-anchoring transpeptidase ErfK/SrfK
VAPSSSGSPAVQPVSSSASPEADSSPSSSTGAPQGPGAPGALDETGWTAGEPLELGATYEATATATNEDGVTSTGSVVFSVISEDASSTAKMMPLDSETVGVGMPVVVILSRAVPEDRRQALTDAITVDRPAEIEGAWRWISDTTVHWRTKDYWPSGTKVRVQVPLTQVDLGDGTWGQADRDISFTVGDAHVSVADTNTHQMTTTINGAAARTIPISAGREDSDPHFVTRSGVHLVSEKYADYLMDGATVGLDYETQVKWATRIANSGEFVHGAPWSVPSQGVRNVSHGCLNASDADAEWFYGISQRGDVVEVTGTDRPLELTNGLGDWTLSWEQWQA